MRSLIAVIGEGTTSHPEIATLAEEVGRLIAEARFGLRTWETAIAGRLSGVLVAQTPQDALSMALAAGRP